jgi:phage terminase large subunit-like protein
LKTHLQGWDNGYVQGVISGDIAACKWVILACERHAADIEKDWQYVFDEARALKAINFIELLPHTKGRWAARSELMHLEPWQRFIIGQLFGWVHIDTGLRRYREAYIEIARKNGKSMLAAAIGLYMLLADGEFGAEVYSGATTEKQAWEVFRPARLMARKTPALLEHYGLEVNASNLLRLTDFSKFEPLIGNPGDGASPSCAIIDEYHEHKSPDQYETMQTGMGSREQPLLLAITTAGTNLAGPCYEKRNEVKKVLEGVFDDPRIFGLIYTIDDGDDWTDPAAWPKSNPNLGVSVSEDYLTAQVQGAVRVASKQNAIKTKHFNVWSGARNAWFNMEQWRAAGDESLRLEDFSDCSAIVPLDLASKIDLAATGLLFWRDIDSKRHYYWFPKFYLPYSALQNSKNAAQFEGWAASGHIEIMDGEEISISQIEADVKEMGSSVSVAEVVYDPWQATQLAQNLRDDGVTAVEFRNTVQNMSPAMLELEGALASGRFHHNDNPCMTWNASNVVAKVDKKDNVFPTKDAPEQKIDGAVALIMGIGRAVYGDGTDYLSDFLSAAV